MELVAQAVLADCYLAHEMMEAETDHNRLRVQWIGALALLRLVGEVLNKIDGQAHIVLRPKVDAQFELDRHDPIFRDFIKGARDRAVHEYSHDLLDESVVPIIVPSADGGVEQFELDECLFMPLVGGYAPEEGASDARDVYYEALQWWERHISLIMRDID